MMPSMFFFKRKLPRNARFHPSDFKDFLTKSLATITLFSWYEISTDLQSCFPAGEVIISLEGSKAWTMKCAKVKSRHTSSRPTQLSWSQYIYQKIRLTMVEKYLTYLNCSGHEWKFKMRHFCWFWDTVSSPTTTANAILPCQLSTKVVAKPLNQSIIVA